MGGKRAAPQQPTILDTQTWKPIVTALAADPNPKKRKPRNSPTAISAGQNVPMQSILNDRLG